MTLPKIETFEHDIADEVLKKESDATKLSASDALIQDVQKEATKIDASAPKSSSSVMWIVIALVIIIILGAGGYFAYTYFMKPSPEAAVPAKAAQTGSQAQAAAPAAKSFFEKTFPELADGMGRYVQKAERNPYGFTITITDYSPVFSFVIRNESLFADSAANALDIPADYRSGPYSFTDTTIANNNMRVGTSGSSSVVYAFIGNNALVISTSTEGITQAAGAIIR